MFERITEKTFDEIFPLLESAFPVTELRMKEDQRALLKEPCYRLYGVRREGAFAATFATWEIEDFLYIEHFAVKEEYRNGGYGGMLLDALVFNSYPYLQPPMRKGQGVLPLRLMTKPAAIDAKTYQRYKKRIHSIVYKYEGDL